MENSEPGTKADIAKEKGLLFTPQLPCPYGSQQQISQHIRPQLVTVKSLDWSEEEGRKRNQAQRKGGETGGACNVQPAAWSGAGADQAWGTRPRLG